MQTIQSTQSVQSVQSILRFSTTPEIRAFAPATCGELVQGYLDGNDFLVNCPIGLFASSWLSDHDQPGLCVAEPDQYGKVTQALRRLSDRLQRPVCNRVHVDSPIPRGKGMASSTADLSAALHAVCAGNGLKMSPIEFSRLLTSVEPSDCTHLPGIAHVNQLTGEWYDCLPAPDDLSVVVVDCGGEIDTQQFDRERAHQVYLHESGRVRHMLALVKQGLRGQDPQQVADAATMSAELSQRILRKPQFDDLRALARDAGALGVNCAHSGTVLGLLYRSQENLGPLLIERIEAEMAGDVTVIGNYRIIGGGCVEC